MSRSDDATELKIFIDNEYDLYKGQKLSIQKSLATKMARGEYKHDLAVKLFMYLVESGAKKYAKAYSVGTDWNRMFNVPTRREVAEDMTNEFEVEAKLGNYDYLLPKKYQAEGTPAAKRMKAQATRVAARTSHLPRKPWYAAQQWSVEAVATRDSPGGSAPGGYFKKGDWIEIYCVKTKQQAEKDAARWKAEHYTPTRVVPGPGHKTRRSGGEKKSSAQLDREINEHLGRRR